MKNKFLITSPLAQTWPKNKKAELVICSESAVLNFKNLEEQLSINASSNQNKNIKSNNYDYRFILIHTFSHLLMRQLEIECGYSLTEIKERIYFSEEENMAGLWL